MTDSRKNVDILFPQFPIKTLENIYLKLDLPDWYFYIVFAAVILADLSSTCNSPRLNLSVIIFIIRLLSSNSAKISFSNPLLIPEKIFLFPVKISNALCLSRDVGQYLDTLNFSQFANSCCQTLHDQKEVFRKNFRATTRVWSKISYGDK